MNPNDPYMAYYRRQQVGGSVNSVYRGGVQRGDGIGSFLGGLFRSVVPLLRSGASAIGREALRTGVGFLGDVAGGTTVPREAASARLKEFTGALKRKADSKLERVLYGGGRVAYKKRRVQRVTPQSLAKLLRRRTVSVKRKTTRRATAGGKRRKTVAAKARKQRKTRRVARPKRERDIFG